LAEALRGPTTRASSANEPVTLLSASRIWRYEPTDIGPEAKLGLDLVEAGIRTVIWATGFRPDYSWLDVPVLDRKGRIRHDGGVVAAPGLYVMGLPFMRRRKSSFMRRRKSSFIDGAVDDAGDLAAHLNQSLARAAA
jgi:putative flavoprotein involved in K+ transport